MTTSAISALSLASAQGMDGILCGIMLLRGRSRRFPALLFFVALDLVATVLITAVDAHGVSTSAYSYMYFAYAVASFLAQLFVLYELTKDILQPAGFWNRLALRPLSLRAAIGIALALVASFFLPAAHLAPLQAWIMRSDVFTSLVTCGLVTALFMQANNLGLPWRSHTIAIGGGFMFWSLLAASLEGFETYLDPQRSHDLVIGYIRAVDYVLVLGYWCVSLWYNEPARKPISPALQKYVLAIHEQVRLDLGRAGH